MRTSASLLAVAATVGAAALLLRWLHSEAPSNGFSTERYVDGEYVGGGFGGDW